MQKADHGPLPGAHPAHAAGDDDAAALGVLVLQVQAAVLDGLEAGGQSKLGEAVRILDLFQVFFGKTVFTSPEDLSQVKAGNLSGNKWKVIRRLVLGEEFLVEVLQMRDAGLT